jgi:hypothetical protein
MWGSKSFNPEKKDSVRDLLSGFFLSKRAEITDVSKYTVNLGLISPLIQVRLAIPPLVGSKTS